MVFRADTKKVSGTDDISQGLYLSKLKKNCIYGNQGLTNNQRAESNFIKNTSKFKKNGTVVNEKLTSIKKKC